MESIKPELRRIAYALEQILEFLQDPHEMRGTPPYGGNTCRECGCNELAEYEDHKECFACGAYYP